MTRLRSFSHLKLRVRITRCNSHTAARLLEPPQEACLPGAATAAQRTTLRSRRGARYLCWHSRQGSGAAPGACRRAASSTAGGWPWRKPSPRPKPRGRPASGGGGGRAASPGPLAPAAAGSPSAARPCTAAIYQPPCAYNDTAQQSLAGSVQAANAEHSRTQPVSPTRHPYTISSRRHGLHALAGKRFARCLAEHVCKLTREGSSTPAPAAPCKEGGRTTCSS